MVKSLMMVDFYNMINNVDFAEDWLLKPGGYGNTLVKIAEKKNPKHIFYSLLMKSVKKRSNGCFV